MKKYLKWLIAVVSIIIFIVLGLMVLVRKDLYLDNIVYNFISKYISNDLTKFILYLTYMGSTVVVISITVIALIFFKNKKYGICLSIDLICITILQYFFKYIFLRERPVGISLISQGGYSFPSGHSLTVMAFYGLIIYFIYKSKLLKKNKVLYITFFVLLIIMTGFSRIYLGVHYFTDVIGGFTFSIFYLIIFTHILERLHK